MVRVTSTQAVGESRFPIRDGMVKVAENTYCPADEFADSIEEGETPLKVNGKVIGTVDEVRRTEDAVVVEYDIRESEMDYE